MAGTGVRSLSMLGATSSIERTIVLNILGHITHARKRSKEFILIVYLWLLLWHVGSIAHCTAAAGYSNVQHIILLVGRLPYSCSRAC